MIIWLRLARQEHIPSVNLVHDRLSQGRRCRMLTMLSKFARQAKVVFLRASMRSGYVPEVLNDLFLRYVQPEFIRSDNVRAFTSKAVNGSFERIGVRPVRSYPGSLWENGGNEHFNGTLRCEALHDGCFMTIKQRDRHRSVVQAT